MYGCEICGDLRCGPEEHCEECFELLCDCECDDSWIWNEPC